MKYGKRYEMQKKKMYYNITKNHVKLFPKDMRNCFSRKDAKMSCLIKSIRNLVATGFFKQTWKSILGVESAGNFFMDWLVLKIGLTGFLRKSMTSFFMCKNYVRQKEFHQGAAL